MKTMTNHNSLCASLLLALLAFTSCEKIIDISIPDQERKIVVNGLISHDKPVRVHLSRSLSVLENDSIIPLTGGDVQLYHGSDLVGKLQEESGGYYYLPDFVPQVGESYRLTASGNGLNPVDATALLPASVPFVSVDTATLVGEWGQQELRLSVKFRDPAGERNIYGFGVEVTYKEYDYRTMTYTGEKISHLAYLQGQSDRFLQDESLNFDGKLFFEDLLFNGQTKSIEFGMSDYSYFESDTVWLTIKMEQIDPSYFRYVVSSESYRSANGNPFAEPVQVYTNVNGGYGIFAGSSATEYSIVTLGMKKFR